jgi:hypothetical protein
VRVADALAILQLCGGHRTQTADGTSLKAANETFMKNFTHLPPFYFAPRVAECVCYVAHAGWPANFPYGCSAWPRATALQAAAGGRIENGSLFRPPDAGFVKVRGKTGEGNRQFTHNYVNGESQRGRRLQRAIARTRGKRGYLNLRSLPTISLSLSLSLSLLLSFARSLEQTIYDATSVSFAITISCYFTPSSCGSYVRTPGGVELYIHPLLAISRYDGDRSRTREG